MSFNTNTGRAEYTASTGQTVFPFVFKIFNDSDIKVYQTPAGNNPDDTNDLLILTTDYTVTIDGDAGGQITLISAASSGDAITLLRDLPVTREVEYQTSGDLLAETLNDDQEYQTYLLADNKGVSDRTLVFPESTQNMDNVLPVPEALKLLRWRSDEKAIENTVIADDGVFVNIFNINTIAELSTVNPDIYSTVNVRGYHSANDGGGGLFNYDASQSAVNNGGTIINGWVRQYSGAINVLWFGAYNNNTNPTDTVSAIENAIATLEKVIFFPSGEYSVNSTIQVNQGQKIQGISGGRFSTKLSKIIMTLDDTLVFDQSSSTSTGQEDAFSCNDMYIESDRGIRLNDETILVGTGEAAPFLMRGEFKRNTFVAKTSGHGYGILASKMFDSIIELNEFRLHARELVLQGCDINKVVTNRIWSFTEYGILELGVGTFGSQNLIENNDILNAGATGVYIKTTAQHIRIKDNYLEKAIGLGGCKGFIDASLVDAPSYGSNPIATNLGFSVVITENRIDGQVEATDFVYKIDPTKMISCIIEDSLTPGVAATEWIDIVDDYLPIMFSPAIVNDFRLRGGVDSDRRFNKFENKKIQYKADSIIVDAESLVSMDRTNFAANNAYQHLFLDTNGIIVKPSLGSTIAQLVLANVGAIANPWMKSGENWEVSIMARTLTGTDTVDILIMKDGSGSGNVSTGLTTQNTNIVIAFTAGTSSQAMGIGIRRLNTPINDVLIQSIEFRKV